MGEGEWSLRDSNGPALCSKPFRLSVPRATSYTIQIAPYFTQDYSLADFQHGTDDIEVSREEGDPLPLPPVGLESGPIADSEMYRIAGTFELLGTSGEEFFNLAILGCSGIGGYSDITAGAQITVRNEFGDILAVSRLEPDPLAGTDECRFQFTAEVPEAAFYSLTMGRRGEITYAFEDMVENDWTVELTLGP